MHTSSPVERSTPAFRQTVFALFVAGFSTFVLMYCVQPLLPELAAAFSVSAASASLALSLTTGMLSLTLLAGGALFERIPRKTVIAGSLACTALVTLASAQAPSWEMFLLTRGLAGIAFAGLPAIAMAYIGEEITRKAAGLAMGLYVAGTALGGMSGRMAAAALTDAFGWRIAVGAAGAVGLAAALLVATLLPVARHSRPATLPAGGLPGIYRRHLDDPLLRQLFAQGFLFMGVFVAVFNYLAFRLLEPPYQLGHASIGAIFLLYLLGMVSSPWAGAAAESWGRRRTLACSLAMMLAGTLLTLVTPLTGVISGLGLLSLGFFAAHAVTSTWVGQRAADYKAQASSLYLVFYYVGASVTGTLAGTFWSTHAWPGVAGAVLVPMVVALALVTRMDPA